MLLSFPQCHVRKYVFEAFPALPKRFVSTIVNYSVLANLLLNACGNKALWLYCEITEANQGQRVGIASTLHSKSYSALSVLGFYDGI